MHSCELCQLQFHTIGQYEQHCRGKRHSIQERRWRRKQKGRQAKAKDTQDTIETLPDVIGEQNYTIQFDVESNLSESGASINKQTEETAQPEPTTLVQTFIERIISINKLSPGNPYVKFLDYQRLVRSNPPILIRILSAYKDHFSQLLHYQRNCELQKFYLNIEESFLGKFTVVSIDRGKYEDTWNTLTTPIPTKGADLIKSDDVAKDLEEGENETESHGSVPRSQNPSSSLTHHRIRDHHVPDTTLVEFQLLETNNTNDTERMINLGDTLWITTDRLLSISDPSSTSIIRPMEYVLDHGVLEGTCIHRSPHKIILSFPVIDLLIHSDIEVNDSIRMMTIRKKYTDSETSLRCAHRVADSLLQLFQAGDTVWYVYKAPNKVQINRALEALDVFTSSLGEIHPFMRAIIALIGADSNRILEPNTEMKSSDGQNLASTRSKAGFSANDNPWGSQQTSLISFSVDNLKTSILSTDDANSIHNQEEQLLWHSKLVRQIHLSNQLFQFLHSIPLQVQLTDESESRLHEFLARESLNDSQKDAVLNACTKRLAIIQGPIGTGKTTTAISILKAYTQCLNYSPILVCAYTHVGTDQLFEGCIKQGIRAIRIGSLERIRPSLHQYSLSYLVKNHPDIVKWKTMAQSVANTLQIHPVDTKEIEKKSRLSATLASIYRKLQNEEDRVTKMYLSQAEVISSTIIGAGSPELQSIHFHSVMIDECSQCTEPNSLVAIIRAQTHLVLLGDQCQLPPPFMIPQLQKSALAVSIFERMIQNKSFDWFGKNIYTPEVANPIPARTVQNDHPYFNDLQIESNVESEYYDELPTNWYDALLTESVFDDTKVYISAAISFLRMQYRMHPSLVKWISKTFYNNLLVSAPKTATLVPPVGLPWIGNEPILFIDVAEGKETVDSNSRLNLVEANVLMRLMDVFLLEPDAKKLEIGILTPYGAQQKLLKSLLLTRATIRNAIEFGSNVEIANVDAYQGREKDVILFSCVRANSTGNLGFLNDIRRLNVSISRARRGLLIVGNVGTLKGNPTWRSLIEYLEERRLVVNDKDAHSILR